MGMAASQARYLALTARKTNTEWEGQQINQARTALANQSANLFNQLLGLKVPQSPNKTDYTEIQYAYNDGNENDSVISEWTQLSNPNPDYNYVVKHYYMANLLTGSKKELQDPQVQLGDVLKELNYDPATTNVEKVQINSEDGIKVTYKINNQDNTQNYRKINDTDLTDTNLKTQLASFETAKDMAKADGTLNTDSVYGYLDEASGVWHFFVANEYDKINSATEGTPLYKALEEFEKEHNLLGPGETLTFDGIYGYEDSDGNWHFKINAKVDTNPIMDPLDYNDYSTAYNSPAYVGNSKLTELNKLNVDKERGIDQVSELAQILRDCPNDPINQYIRFNAKGELEYDGAGIYTFMLNGKSYYTTQYDLMNSYNSTTRALNTIDTQSKLNYYNAAIIPRKIEETNNALLETDGNGRFTSVKFDNDSLTYSLKVEQKTNEVAYEDAHNRYLYEKAQYEKTIADINAKTSIIQKEDRTLELRLKQLDTEQNALATEMDAVKKVIKDNVEKTFKTFSD